MAAATRPSSSLHLFFFLILLSCFACSSSFVESTRLVFSLKRRDILLNTFHNDLSNQPSAPLYPPLTNPVTNPAAAISPPLPPPLENPAPPTPTVPATYPVGVTPIPPTAAAAQGGAIPVTNPVTTPAGGAQPVANPVTATPTPTTIPIPNPNPTTSAPPAAAAAAAQGGAIPVTNPVTTPAGGAQPVTNPVTTTPTPTTIPNPNPNPTTSAPPAVPGQSWCVAKSGLTQTSLQTALDYACGLGGADCSAIQQGGSCYNPNTLQNHASFAFNSYYQKNPVQTSCDFGGTAMVTNQNPSTGSCVYPTSSASGTPSITPTTTTPSIMPTTTTPSTTPAAGTDAPPNVLNSSTTNYPPLGGGTSTGGILGASPPADGSYISVSSHLQAYVGSIALVASITSTVLISPIR